MEYKGRLTGVEINHVNRRMKEKVPSTAIAAELYVLFRDREGDRITPEEVEDAYNRTRSSKSGCLGLLLNKIGLYRID